MNLETYKDNISSNVFIKDGGDFKVPDRTFHISYKEFIKYFSEIKGKISKHNLIIGINFTYGLMPTMLNYRSDKFSESLKILNEAKKVLL